MKFFLYTELIANHCCFKMVVLVDVHHILHEAEVGSHNRAEVGNQPEEVDIHTLEALASVDILHKG